VHAFDGNTGAESWSYLPKFLMQGLYALADTGYNLQHRYFVDGSPESFDVYDTTAGAWKTILIGGAGGGGNGFYALDITNESAPNGLWEFCNDSTVCTRSDADLGLSYGNPVVGKRSSDGRWVVVLTSGLNNNGATATGHGFFYVLDAITGQVLNKVDTGVGTTGTPSGLMKSAAFYDSAASDATFQFVYGGDQLGNVWRLDMGTTSGTCAAPAPTGSTPPCVTHVATLRDSSGFAQPITTKPALTHISGNRVIYIGTGRYLGNQDLSDVSASTGIAWQQTFYGFKDKNADYGTNIRTGANLVVQTLTLVNTTDRGITSNPVDWNTKDGWLVDFNPSVDPSPGERVNIDPRLVLGTLKVATNTPAGGGACSIGGTSRVYDFDFRTGSAIVGSGGVVGRSLGATIAVGMAIVQLPSGAIKDIVTGADTTKTTVDVQIGSAGSGVRRFSYRER
jgi:type IV pilus assembly protein PilY1